jgi:hypothetical protein
MLELNHKFQSNATRPVQKYVQMKLIKFEAQFLVVLSDDTALGEMHAQLEQTLLGITEQQ